MPELTRRALLGGASAIALLAGTREAEAWFFGRRARAGGPGTKIVGVSLSNTSFQGGSPSGTVVGAITVNTVGGAFKGTLSLSGTNAANFWIVGTNLETNGTDAAGASYAIDMVATQSGASGSPHTQAFTLIGTSTAGMIAAVSVSNYGTSTVPPDAQVTFAQPFAPGDIPSSGSLQIRSADGQTVLGGFQQDQESTWLQDGSCKVAAISFLTPDSFPPPVRISSLTWASDTATVTTISAHRLSTTGAAGNRVVIQNCAEDCWNDVWTYNVTGSHTFQITIPTVTISATATKGSRLLTNASSIAGLNSYGLVVRGPGVPFGTISSSAGGGAILMTRAISGLLTSPRRGTYTFRPPATGTTYIATVSGTANATAAQVVEYQIWSNSAAKNQSLNVTQARIMGTPPGSNSDIKLYFTGYDLGSDVWEVSVNDIFQNGNGAAWAPTSGPGWGTNPTRGWEIIRSGPVCTEWRLWSVLRRISDGAWHPWLRGWIYLRCWGMNSHNRPILEVSGGWMQPNLYGPNPGSPGVSTNSGPDFAFATFRTSRSPTAGSGWTAISGADFLLTEYRSVATARTKLQATYGSGAAPVYQGIGDAIVGGSLDEHVHATNGGATASSMSLPALSTSGANRVVVICFLSNSYGGLSVTSTSGLSFSRRKQISSTISGTNLYLEEWYAVASSQLTNEATTITLTGSGTYITADAFAVAGANTASAATIFDGASDLPANLTANIIEPSHIFTATLCDGGTALQHYGGPRDYRTQFTNGMRGYPVPLGASTVNISNHQITLTRQQFNALLGAGAMKGYDNGGTYAGGNGGRIPVVFSVSYGGSLPAPLRPYDGTRNTIYWISGPYNQGNAVEQFTIQVATDAANAFGISPLSLTSTGSGRMAITPLAFCFAGAAGLALDPATVGRIWRNGKKPTLLVGHDFTYLTTQSRVLPPYLANTVVAQQTAFAPSWSQGSTYFAANIGGYGDDNVDDLIGYLMEHNAQELYRPFDRPLHQMNLAIAASWIEVGGYERADESTGLPVVPVNATSYPYLAAPRPGGGWNSGIFTAQGSSAAQDQPWPPGGSGSAVARDHSPCPEIMPYLKTGDHLYIDSLLFAHNTSLIGVFNSTASLPGYSTFYRPWTFVYYVGNGTMQDAIFGKGRGMAWCCRTMGFGLHVFPATRPELPYFRDMWNSASQVPMAVVKTGTQTGYLPRGAQTLGVWCGLVSDPVSMPASLGYVGPPCETERWMDDWQFASFAQEAWKGEYPGFLSFLQNYFYRGTIGRVDEVPAIAGQPPGFIWAANMSQTYYLIGKKTAYDTWARTWNDVYAWCGLAPFFVGGPNLTATATVRRGSHIISKIDSHDIGTWSGAINFGGGLRWVNTIPNFDFPAWTVTNTLNTQNATLAVMPFPGTVFSTVASRSQTRTEIMVARVPVPWLGIADMKATYPAIMNNQMNIGTPGGDFPSNCNGYVCYLTWALGMAKILYDRSVAAGTPVAAFQNAEAIYTEIRRRQCHGSGPYDPNPLSFRNYPKYGIGYIGAPS